VPKSSPTIIGWKERARFPDWHVRNLIIKADTGARTGAIDVADLEELPGDRVRFQVRLNRKTGRLSRAIETDVVRRATVRGATGHAHDRLFVETTLRLGPVKKKIELSLVCRRRMLCRVLLGRRALEGDFLVDSGAKYLLGDGRAKKRTNDEQAVP
jgi:hypothetical protein